MGDTQDLTLEILRQIRDAVVQTNARLDQTNARLDQTNARLDQTREELTARLDRHERLLVRLADESEVHSRALVKLIERVDALDGRLENLLTGPLGTMVRAHDVRLTSLEADVAELFRRTG